MPQAITAHNCAPTTMWDTRWFYRERKEEGLWIPFSHFDSQQIESSYRRRKRESFFLPGLIPRRIFVAKRLCQDVESQEQTHILRGTWYFARSDKMLQPYSEALAAALLESLQTARNQQVDMRKWSFDAGDGRIIYAALGGGYVQLSSTGTVRLVTRLFVAHGHKPSYAVLKAPMLAKIDTEYPEEGPILKTTTPAPLPDTAARGVIPAESGNADRAAGLLLLPL